MAGPNDKNNKTPPADKGALNSGSNSKEVKGAGEHLPDPAAGFLGKIQDSAVTLTNSFVELAKGSYNLKDALGVVGSEAGKYGGVGKAVGAGAYATQKVFDVGDTGRENYKKLAEAVSAATGTIAGDFVKAGAGIDVFSDHLAYAGEVTGQTFDEITSGVSRLLKVSSDIGSSQVALGTAVDKTKAAFAAYTEVVATSRNIGLELNESLDLSEQLFKQQGLTIENTADRAESSLGTMRALNKAIEGTGVSIQAATKFVKENASAYEFLNWSSRKTSLTLGSVASFAKENKDIFKSTEQGINLYGKALQGTAAIQQDFGKSMFFGIAGQGGIGKGGLEAMYDFQNMEGPEALQSVMDTIGNITGGDIKTEKEARAEGGTALQQHMVRTQMLMSNFNLSLGEAKKLQDSMARFRVGDAEAGQKAQEILQAATSGEGITGGEGNYQKELYTSSEMGNSILSDIRSTMQRGASSIQSNLTPQMAKAIFGKIEGLASQFAPPEAKQIYEALKDKSGQKLEGLKETMKGFTSGPIEQLGNALDELQQSAPPPPIAGATSQPTQKQAPSKMETPKPSLPQAGEMPQQGSSAPSPSTGVSTPSASQAPKSSPLGVSPLPVKPQASTQVGLKSMMPTGISMPQLGISSAMQNKLTYDAAAKTAFASGGALDANIVGKIASAGSTSNEFGIGMAKQGTMNIKTKGIPGAEDASKYKPQSDLTFSDVMGNGLTPGSGGSYFSSASTPWEQTGEKLLNKTAGAPGQTTMESNLLAKLKELAPGQQAPVNENQLGAKHKTALTHFNQFLAQMQGKNLDVNSTVQGVNAVGYDNTIYDVQKARDEAKKQGNMELYNTLQKWEEVYSLGKGVQTSQYGQAGNAVSKEVSYAKTSTSKSGFDIGNIISSAKPGVGVSKYTPKSKGDFMDVFTTPAPTLKDAAASASKTSKPAITSKEFPSAASLQIPQLDGGATAQAVIMDKNKKEAAAQASAQKASTPTPPVQAPSSQGSPLTAQVILNVNGNALMETLVSTTAFEKGVQTQVNSDKVATYKNFGNKTNNIS